MTTHETTLAALKADGQLHNALSWLGNRMIEVGSIDAAAHYTEEHIDELKPLDRELYVYRFDAGKHRPIGIAPLASSVSTMPPGPQPQSTTRSRPATGSGSSPLPPPRRTSP